MDSFLLDLGLKTFTSLKIVFASTIISLNDVPKNIFATNFPSLTKKYGLMCKKLVENQKQRISYWEDKGNKKIKWIRIYYEQN